MQLVGHNFQRKALKDFILSARLPSTLMFSGSSGIGKRLVALELARSLLCDRNTAPLKDLKSSAAKFVYGGCASCKACSIFDAYNHPDFHAVECLNDESSRMEALRALLVALQLKPFLGSNRVVLFDNAENLSHSAANALLKTLEEPRQNTYLILITSNPAKLPATLVSRCQMWYFSELARGEIFQILSSKYSKDASRSASTLTLSEERIEKLSGALGGSLENIELMTVELERWEELTGKLDQIFKGDGKLALDLAQELGKDKERLPLDLNLIRTYVRERLLLLSNNPSSNNHDYSKWANALTNLIAAERLIFERNLAPAYVLTNIFLFLINDSALNSFTTFSNSATLVEDLVV